MHYRHDQLINKPHYKLINDFNISNINDAISNFDVSITDDSLPHYVYLSMNNGSYSALLCMCFYPFNDQTTHIVTDIYLKRHKKFVPKSVSKLYRTIIGELNSCF